jgi:hypothetical protein
MDKGDYSMKVRLRPVGKVESDAVESMEAFVPKGIEDLLFIRLPEGCTPEQTERINKAIRGVQEMTKLAGRVILFIAHGVEFLEIETTTEGAGQ